MNAAQKAKQIEQAEQKMRQAGVLLQASWAPKVGQRDEQETERATRKRAPSSRAPSSVYAIEIEDGIAIPKPNAGSNGFPFRKLAVGQSFFVPATSGRKSFSSVPRYNKLLAPKRFTCRAWTQPDGTRGFRVWRVA